MSFPQYPTSAPPQQWVAGPPPVQVWVAGPAPQRRLTVLVRLILVIPHLVALFFLEIAALIVAFLGWWGALFMGRLPEFATSYLAGFIRWSTRVAAYTTLLTDAYPPFSLEDEPGYPVRIAMTRERLNRAAVFFRFILTIPAAIVANVIGYGAFTIVAIVAWFAVLITGKLPSSLHLAYAAVLRYQTRYYCYEFMLTPAYPVRGLLGDDAAAEPPAPPAEPWATPAEPWATPAEPWATPAQPWAPAAEAGTPADPAAWRLFLTPAAKGLVIFFIVLGVVLYGAGSAVSSVFDAHTLNNTATTGNAIDQMNSSFGKLSTQLNRFPGTLNACGHRLKCVTAADGRLAGDISAFATTVQSTQMPASAQPAANRVYALATKSAQDLTQLSQATSANQYQSIASSTGLENDLNQFGSSFNTLADALNNARP